MIVSAAIAKKHGGAIGVSSNGIPGEGCVFYVEIDTTTLDETSGELTTLSPHALASQDSENRALQLSAFRETQQTSRKGLHSIVSNRSSGPRRVLVVDDSLLNVKMIVRGVRPFFDVVTEVKVRRLSFLVLKTLRLTLNNRLSMDRKPLILFASLCFLVALRYL